MEFRKEPIIVDSEEDRASFSYGGRIKKWKDQIVGKTTNGEGFIGVISN